MHPHQPQIVSMPRYRAERKRTSGPFRDSGPFFIKTNLLDTEKIPARRLRGTLVEVKEPPSPLYSGTHRTQCSSGSCSPWPSARPGRVCEAPRPLISSCYQHEPTNSPLRETTSGRSTMATSDDCRHGRSTSEHPRPSSSLRHILLAPVSCLSPDLPIATVHRTLCVGVGSPGGPRPRLM